MVTVPNMEATDSLWIAEEEVRGSEREGHGAHFTQLLEASHHGSKSSRVRLRVQF